MPASHPTTLEDEIRDLLEQTRQEAHMYSSAHYKEPGRPGKDGLNMRLDAIEKSLVILAAAIDRR